jgi:hypothetical protein
MVKLLQCDCFASLGGFKGSQTHAQGLIAILGDTTWGNATGTPSRKIAQLMQVGVLEAAIGCKRGTTASGGVEGDIADSTIGVIDQTTTTG